MKKLCIIPGILLFMLFLMPIHANETQGLVFDGDANEFIVQENNTKGFEDMMPGVKRRSSFETGFLLSVQNAKGIDK